MSKNTRGGGRPGGRDASRRRGTERRRPSAGGLPAGEGSRASASGRRPDAGIQRRPASGQRRSGGRAASARTRAPEERRAMTPRERDARRRRRSRRNRKAIYLRRRLMVFGGAGLILILLILLVVVGMNKKKRSDTTQTTGRAAGTTVTQAGNAAKAEAAETEASHNASGQDEGGAALTPTPTPTPLPTPTPEPVSILVTAVGDITLGKDENSDYDTSMVAKYEDVGYFDYFLDNVRDIFENDDLTIVNLEGTLTYEEERADKKYAFKADPSYVNIISGSSVEAANLANNHSKDYGEDSYTDTIDYVEAAGIKTFGYDRYAVMDVNGVKVGMIGLMEIFTGMDTQDDLLKMLDKVKEEDPDLIIVSMHWGNELEEEPTDIQKALGRMAIDNGADLVIGHHPHVIQGVEKYNGRYICYSVGNFCFGGNAYPTDPDCMIVQERFTFQNGELIDAGEIKTIPCRVSSSYSINNYQPTPLEGDEKERVQNKIDERSALVG